MHTQIAVDRKLIKQL